MRVKPNRTSLKGKIRAIRPEADGWGAEIELLVTRNESASSERDFLQPEPGTTMNFFYAEPAKLKVGDEVAAQATLMAGPFGSRAVLQEVTPLPIVIA